MLNDLWDEVKQAREIASEKSNIATEAERRAQQLTIKHIQEDKILAQMLWHVSEVSCSRMVLETQSCDLLIPGNGIYVTEDWSVFAFNTGERFQLFVHKMTPKTLKTLKSWGITFAAPDTTDIDSRVESMDSAIRDYVEMLDLLDEMTVR